MGGRVPGSIWSGSASAVAAVSWWMVSWSTIQDSISRCLLQHHRHHHHHPHTATNLLSLLSCACALGCPSSWSCCGVSPRPRSLLRISSRSGGNLSEVPAPASWPSSPYLVRRVNSNQCHHPRAHLILRSERSRSRASRTRSRSVSRLSPALMSSRSRMLSGRHESPPAAPILLDMRRLRR